MHLNHNVTVSRTSRYIDSKLGDGFIILHLNTGVYYGLERAGARVWELLQQTQTLASLAEAIQSEFDVSPGRCFSDVEALVVGLAERDLVELRNANAA